MHLPDDFQHMVSLKNLSTFGIGGAARYCIEISTVEDMQQVIAYCFEMHLAYFILGNGSNCLFDDRGFDGVVIINKIDFFERHGSFVVAGGGSSLPFLSISLSREGLSGLEFASGIPATIGGAIVMNAGSGGCDMSSILVDVTCVTEEGICVTYCKEDLDFGYRSSSLQRMKCVVVMATFALTPDPSAEEKRQALMRYRKETQPLAERSAGCVFRNPLSLSAGALIEQSFMKGAKIGGASVSQVHANFIVNDGGATCADVVALIALVKKQVYNNFDILLEEELRIIPYKSEAV